MNGKQLDLSNLDLLVRVYKKYNQKVAGVFGGEPTLHPDFLDIIQNFSQNELLPIAYSNALMEAEILYWGNRYLCHRDSLQINLSP